jgi:hypothetical protein
MFAPAHPKPMKDRHLLQLCISSVASPDEEKLKWSVNQ